MKNGNAKVVDKRYSDFITLDTALNSPAPLPPKRIIVTTFILVGLTSYLITVLKNPAFEDSVPSTLSRSTAVALVSDLRSGNVVADGGNEERANASGPIAAGYYPDWVSGDSPPENVDFSKFDILFFAFAVPDESGGLTLSSDNLQRLVSSAHNSGNGTQIILSVGVESLVGAVQQYGLDGGPQWVLLLPNSSLGFLYGYVSQSSSTVLSGFAPMEEETTKENLACVHAHPRKKTTATITTAEGEVQTEADTNSKGWYGQQIPFETLVSSGALVKGTGDDGNYREGGGFTIGWDGCSDTPVRFPLFGSSGLWGLLTTLSDPQLYKQSQQTVVTYNDTRSLSDKAVFAKDQGGALLGLLIGMMNTLFRMLFGRV
ncbi:hypothetical protein L218DRAFT_1009002 [Marasmius fiardii PR-910]|nr:hypothetical protein L218DRAFT_1009002 [Marasmius fiardii PR-910]